MGRPVRRIVATIASLGMVTALTPALPASAATPDEPTQTTLDLLDEVAAWTGGIDDAGPLAQRVPLLGVGVGPALGLDDLLTDALADLRAAGQPLGDVDSFDDFDGVSDSTAVGDVNVEVSIDVTDDTDSFKRLLLTVQAERTLADTPFELASTTPKFSLTTDGGVDAGVSLDLTVPLVYELVDSAHTAYVEVGADQPSLAAAVTADVPAGTTLNGAVGILGVDIETTEPLVVDTQLAATVADPNGDGKLYFVEPSGDPGELAAEGSASGLVDVSGPGGNASGAFAVSASPTSGDLELPGISATVSFAWPDLGDADTLTVTPSADFSDIDDFLSMSLRDLADGLGQLTNALGSIQRSRFGDTGNLDLPFMRGTVADAVAVNESLLEFLAEHTVQPEDDPARAGDPTWTSLQDLLDKLDGYSPLPGALVGVGAGAYDATNHRLPLTLTLDRQAPDAEPIYDPDVAFSGPTATYAGNGLSVSGAPFEVDGEVVDLQGRRVVAGLASGTIASNTASSLTLVGPWNGGNPEPGTPWSITGPEVQAGLVELGDVLAGPGERAVRNANALAPVAEVRPSYQASIGLDLDLTPPTPHDPPLERTNPDGTTTLIHETPIGPDRFLIRPADTFLTADLPVTTGIDAFATVGFVRVRVGGDLRMCHPSAGAECAGEQAEDQHMLEISLQGSEPMRFGELFDRLTDTGSDDTTKPADLLDVSVAAAAHAAGSLSVPDAPSFLGSASAEFSITCSDIADVDACTVDTSDLAEIFELDIEPDNPAALLGVVIKTLEALDDGLLGGSLSGGLAQRIPLLGVSVKDIMASTESGAGEGVTYGTTSEGKSTLTDTVHGTFDNSGDRLIGRTVVVGTQQVQVAAVDGDTLTFTGSWDPVPAAGTPYSFVSEISEVIDRLVQDPPTSLQEALTIANERLNSSPISFRYADLGGPHLVVELDWERSFTATRPVRLDLAAGLVDGQDRSLVGTKGSGSVALDASVGVDVGLAVPLEPGDGPGSPAALQVLNDSSVDISLGASVDGTLQASLGPLSLSLGDPSDVSEEPDEIDLEADLDVALTSSGDGTGVEPLTSYLAGLDAELSTGGVSCAASDGVDEPLAVCGYAPVFYTLDGSTWQPIVPDDGDEDTVEANFFALRIPELTDLGDLAGVADGTVAAAEGGTLPQLEVPDATELADVLLSVPLDYDDLVAGLDAYLALIETGMRLASAGGTLPLVGEDLQQGADFVGELRQGIDDALSGLPNGGKANLSALTDAVNNELTETLDIEPGAITVAATCGDLAAVTGVAAAPTDAEDEEDTTKASYVYRVVAYTGNSNTVTFFSDPSVAVTNDEALDDDDFNTVTWEASRGADGYLVLRSDDGGATYVRVADVDDGDTIEYVDDGSGTSAAAPTEPSEAPPIVNCRNVDPSTIEGVTLTFDVGRGNPSASGCDGDDCLRQEVPVDIGIPGLAIRPDRQAPDSDGDGAPDAGLEAVLGYDLHFAVALTRDDGFVVLTDDQSEPELRLGVGIGLIDVVDAADLTAELAILQVNVEKNEDSSALEFAGLFSVDVVGDSGQLRMADLVSDPAAYVQPKLEASVGIDWHLEATADSALPGVSTDLVVGWAWSTADDPGDVTDLSIQFRDVTITFGEFFESVVGPVLREVKRISEPVKPIIDTLYAPIPVLTDLSKAAGGDEVTIVKLAETFSTLSDGPNLTFVRKVLDVIKLVDDIDTMVNTSGSGFTLGTFSLKPGEALAAPATPDRAPDLFDNVEIHDDDARDKFETDGGDAPLDEGGRASEAGFTFPILENPLSAFGLLLNQDVDIVKWDSGPLRLGFEWRQSFGPVYAPPPVYVTISGGAAVQAHIVAGFDTFGIRKAIESGTFETSTVPDAIVQGLYFGTNVAGKPLGVLEFSGQLGAGASVSAVVIEVGVEGVIRLTVSFYWNDPTPDGKFRISEFVQVALNNPICLFTVGGRVSLLLDLWVKVGVGPFSTTFDFNIVDVTLLDFSVTPECEPPPPKLADIDGSSLYVFVGQLGNNDLRGEPWGNDGAAAPDTEVVKVYSLHDYTDPANPQFTGFAVEGFGEYQEYPGENLTTVVVDARDNSRPVRVTFLGDGDQQGGEAAREFTKDAVVLGSDENDVIRTGTGNSYVDGGAGNDAVTTVEAAGKQAWVAGGGGDDSLTVGSGTTVVAGDSALDLSGADDELTLAGRDGDVTVTTVANVPAIGPPSEGGVSGGDDRIGLGLGGSEAFGNGGDDVIGAAADVGAGQAQSNLIVGGHGGDAISGSSAADEIWTGPRGSADAVVTDGPGEFDLIGSPEDDRKQENTVHSGVGDDVVYGSQAVDHVHSESQPGQVAKIYGGAANDVLAGGYGADEVYGGPGNDYVIAEPADVGEVNGTSPFGPRRNVERLPLPGGVEPAAGDRLVGGVGHDHVVGGDGGAFIWGDRYLPEEQCKAGDPVVSDPVDETDDSADGRDQILGGLGSDVASAGGAADDLRLFVGNDLGCGQAGDDVLRGGADEDLLWGGSDSDTVLGGAGQDGVFGNDGNDTQWGGAGQDVLEGNNGVDVAAGGAGDDLVIGGTRAAGRADAGDTLYGDIGIDTLIGDNGGEPAIAPAGTAAPYDLGSTDDPAAETKGAGDVIYGGVGADAAYGGLGDDRIEGGSESDHLEGNNGSDTVLGQSGEDQLVGGSFEEALLGVGRPDAGDTLIGGPGPDVAIGDNGFVDVGASAPVVPGRGFVNPHSITLFDLADSTDPGYPTAGADLVTMGDGNDVALGQVGDDRILGEADDDYLEGGPDTDWIEGGSGDDDLVGGSSTPLGEAVPGTGSAASTGQPDQADVLYSGPGDDTASGDNGTALRGPDSSANRVLDRIGSDPGSRVQQREVIWYDLGDGAVAPDASLFGPDWVSGGSGVDVLFGQDGDDAVSGGAGDDYAEGNGGSDTLRGDLWLTEAVSNDGLVVPDQPAGDWPEHPVSVPALLEGIGQPGQDDLIGGSSRQRFRDAGDQIEGDGEGDMILADGGTLLRVVTGEDGDAAEEVDAARHPETGGLPADVFHLRVGDDAVAGYNGTTRFCSSDTAETGETCEPSWAYGNDLVFGDGGDDRVWGQDGDDQIRGENGHDDLFGELGDDHVWGGADEDAIVGDRGGVRGEYVDSSDGLTFTLTLNAVPQDTYVGLPEGTLDRRTDLLADTDGTSWVGGTDEPVPHPGLTEGGADRLRGGPGRDSIHGGFGDDLANGDGGGDEVFGGDGADVLWGGRGCEGDQCVGGDPSYRGENDEFVDHVLGGTGATDGPSLEGALGSDIIDWNPRGTHEPGVGCTTDRWPDDTPGTTLDPCEWFEMTGKADGDPGTDQHHHGTDWIYGGWDRDVMQGDESANGPSEQDDRLIDWNGAYNLYTHCNAAYGGWNDIRQHSPWMNDFLAGLAYGMGAGRSLDDATASGTSAFRELAYVYPSDNRDHGSGKAFPTTPGHFDDPAACPLS